MKGLSFGQLQTRDTTVAAAGAGGDGERRRQLERRDRLAAGSNTARAAIRLSL
jgi:hypothetical protein